MNFRKSLFVAVMLIGALVLVACGGGDGGNNNAGTTGGSTNLTQTISGDDGSSVQYPEGWVAQGESGSFLIANSQELLNMAMSGEEPEAIESGQVFVTVTVLPSAGQLPEGTSLADMISMFASEGLPSSDPNEFTIDGKEAVSVSGTSDALGGISAGSYLVIINDAEAGNLTLAMAITAPGEEGNIADTVNAIAASAQPANAEG